MKQEYCIKSKSKSSDKMIKEFGMAGADDDWFDINFVYKWRERHCNSDSYVVYEE